MEKQTRVNKYKDLREEMKEEVAINRQAIETPVDEDDDFLAFIPKTEKPHLEDTLMEPLSYETLKQDNDEIMHALNEAKVNVGKEQYNTRLDILSKIKQDETDHIPAHVYQNEDFTKGHIEEEPQKKMTLLEKLAAMSPEEDAEELRKFEEGLTVADLMKEKKKVKKEQVVKDPVKKTIVEEPEDQDYDDDDYNYGYEENDDEGEGESKLVTILNYVIIVFIVIFVVLAFFIAKQLFF